MGRELMWVCGILPETLNREIVSICRDANQKIGLPETVFRFPLHISMKKSFYTEDFKTVKQTVVDFLLQKGIVPCRTGLLSGTKGCSGFLSYRMPVSERCMTSWMLCWKRTMVFQSADMTGYFSRMSVCLQQAPLSRSKLCMRNCPNCKRKSILN